MRRMGVVLKGRRGIVERGLEDELVALVANGLFALFRRRGKSLTFKAMML